CPSLHGDEMFFGVAHAVAELGMENRGQTGRFLSARESGTETNAFEKVIHALGSKRVLALAGPQLKRLESLAVLCTDQGYDPQLAVSGDGAGSPEVIEAVGGVLRDNLTRGLQAVRLNDCLPAGAECGFKVGAAQIESLDHDVCRRIIQG